MNWFETIKRYYSKYNTDGERLWTAEMVQNAVTKGKITKEEYQKITNISDANKV